MGFVSCIRLVLRIQVKRGYFWWPQKFCFLCFGLFVSLSTTFMQVQVPFGWSLSIMLCIFLFYEEHGCNRGGREIQMLRRWAPAVVAGQDLCAWMSSIRLGVPCLVSDLLQVLMILWLNLDYRSGWFRDLNRDELFRVYFFLTGPEAFNYF